MNDIIYFPNKFLRLKSNKIPSVTKQEIDISSKMIDIMKKADGLGLAANQIGILKKIITINIQDTEKNNDKTYVLFNPIIKRYSNKKIILEEGCLSLPKQYAHIERSESILIEYIDKYNNIIKEEKFGIEARVLQHEIDHLFGKLFIDHLSSLKRNMIIKRLSKLKKTGQI